MNTVTLGPEPSPASPYRTHESDSPWVDHHVECGTNTVTRSARRCDWEGLSGRRQFASKDTLPPLEEDALETIRSKSARNPRMQSLAIRSEVERLSPGAEERMKGAEGHIQPWVSPSTHSKPPTILVLAVTPAIITLVSSPATPIVPKRKFMGTR